jgi:hypothetical protein
VSRHAVGVVPDAVWNGRKMAASGFSPACAGRLIRTLSIAVGSVSRRLFRKVWAMPPDTMACGSQTLRLRALEADRSCGWSRKPGDNVENGYVASAVWTDETGYATLPDHQAAVVQGIRGAGTDVDTLGPEGRNHRFSAACLCGRNSMKAIKKGRESIGWWPRRLWWGCLPMSGSGQRQQPDD